MNNQDLTESNKQLIQVCNKVAHRYRHVVPVQSLHWSTEKVHAMTVIQASKKLQEATTDSLEAAILQAGSIGLTLNPVRGHCYLIPRKSRRKRDNETWPAFNADVKTIAYASPSYRGLSHLATNSGAVRFIRAEIIYQGDLWRYFGPHKEPLYEASAKNMTDSKLTTEERATGVFAIAKTKDGDVLCEYVNRDTVLKIRKMSEQPDSLMWHKDKLWTEGWKKAAIRRMYKTLPDSSPVIDEAMALMNKFEGVAPRNDQEQEVEAVVVLSEEQELKLHACLAEHGIEGDGADRWLEKLANKYGVADYRNIPAGKYDDAMNTLTDAMGTRKTG